MNLDQISGLISAVGGLGALLWPLMVVILALKFGPVLMQKFDESDHVILKAAGLEATFHKGQVELAAALAAATTDKCGEDAGAVVDARGIADNVELAMPNSDVFVRMSRSVVLWVDDRPENNIYERRAIEAMGVRIDLALNTAEAMKIARRRSFDLIISDMGRPGDPRAGYTLLDDLRQADVPTPFLIYAGSRGPEHVKEALGRGALGCTNSPQELVKTVAAALGVPRVDVAERSGLS